MCLSNIIDEAEKEVLKTIDDCEYHKKVAVIALCKLLREYQESNGITLEWLRSRFKIEGSKKTSCKTMLYHSATLEMRRCKKMVLEIVGKKVKEVVDKKNGKSIVLDNKANKKQQQGE